MLCVFGGVCVVLIVLCCVVCIFGWVGVVVVFFFV